MIKLSIYKNLLNAKITFIFYNIYNHNIIMFSIKIAYWFWDLLTITFKSVIKLIVFLNV